MLRMTILIAAVLISMLLVGAIVADYAPPISPAAHYQVDMR
jgi:hypothetical protein